MHGDVISAPCVSHKGVFMTTSNDTTWKNIPGYEGIYQASDDGRIRRTVNIRTGASGLLKSCPAPNGYLRLNLMKDKVRITHSVHRLVMLAFVGASDLVVNHKNGVKDDNRLANLEYITHQENVLYSWRVLHRENKTAGTASVNAKLNDELVLEIRARYAAGGITHQKLADIYGVCRSKITHIINRKMWKHV